jgi:hypothetical protein
VHDDEEVVFIVLDFGEGGGGDAVLDGEGMELENAFENRLGFLGGGVGEVDPEDEALVAANKAESLDLKVLADDATVAEDEGLDHAACLAGARLGARCLREEA